MKPTTEERIAMVHRAAELAVEAHAGYFDKAGRPYIEHVARVAKSVRDGDGRYHAQAAAWLHDVVEDTNITLAVLRESFPEQVVQAVDALTRRNDETYMDYILRLAGDEHAVAVKMADLRDNMDLTRLESISKTDLSRLRKYHKAYKFLEKTK